jgi:hypothetical protein
LRTLRFFTSSGSFSFLASFLQRSALCLVSAFSIWPTNPKEGQLQLTIAVIAALKKMLSRLMLCNFEGQCVPPLKMLYEQAAYL